MLVARRLAGLSALGAHYARVRARTQTLDRVTQLGRLVQSGAKNQKIST